MVAGQRRIREEAEQRAQALAGVTRGPVEAEVVAHHLVQRPSGLVAVVDEAKDLGFGVGDEVGDVHTGEHDPMIGEHLRSSGRSGEDVCRIRATHW